MQIFAAASMAVVYWLLLTHPSILASPPDKNEPQGASRVQSPGPFKTELSQAVREPSGVVTIPGDPARTWKDCLGNSVEGQFVGLHGATIFLIVDGDVLSAALAGFCREDRDHVRSVLRARGKATAFPGAADPNDPAAALRLTASQWYSGEDYGYDQQAWRKWLAKRAVTKPQPYSTTERD
jgi:hypothetical protein